MLWLNLLYYKLVNMKVLITGAGGYIGSVGVYLFLQKGYKVAALDNFSTGFRQPLEVLQERFGKGRLFYYKADISRKDQLKKIFTEHPDIFAVVHYAASCKVDESMKNPYLYFSNNTCGGLVLLETMEEFGIKKIVFSSTCAVYGESEYVPVDEKHSLNPTNPYGESKLMLEKIIQWYSRLKGFDYVILRYFNVCGASDDGLIGDSKKPSVLLVQNAVRGALGLSRFYLTAAKVNTPDKTPIRDYINVVDLNEAHIKALELMKKNKEISEVFNLGTGTGNSVLEIIEQIQKITGKKFLIHSSPPRKGEYAKIFADISKAKKILDWKPKRSIKDSVESLIKWYKRNPDGWAY